MSAISYKDKKVISIGVVSELTGLSERQIRYYEERQLIHPERTKGGTRMYSFADVEALVEIANKIEDGLQTYEIRKINEAQKEQRTISKEKMREEIRGQLNVRFGLINRNGSKY